jgi:hypothetical protein
MLVIIYISSAKMIVIMFLLHPSSIRYIDVLIGLLQLLLAESIYRTLREICHTELKASQVVVCASRTLCTIAL